MAENRRTGKLQRVDLVGIGNLLESLVVNNRISRDERDAIILRIAHGNGFSDTECRTLAGYGRSIEEVRARTITPASVGEPTITIPQTDNFISLTEIVRAHSEEAPGYVIQSWLRSSNTLAFLNLWEKENNPNYCEDAYTALIGKKREASFTLTPKLWIEQTKAIGIISKQGKSGGTFAHPMIACEFASWFTPEFKMLLLQMSQFRDKL